MWSARVNKTGSKVQLLKNGNVSKTIEASDESFSPAEAQKFAEDLVKKMNEKVAKQMTDPGAQPDVATKGEQQNESLSAVNQQATGKAVNASENGISKEAFEASENENKLLKRKVAKLEKEAHIERKARRGLQIAKALVEQNKLANDESVIKDKVIEITAMSNDEITLLERKASNQPLYDSVEDANKAARRYARMSRLHKQAAEDAQISGDDNLADTEDLRSAHYESLSKEAYNEAGKYSEAGYNNEADKGTSEDAATQVNKPAQGVDAKGGKSASEEMKSDIDDIMFQAEEDDDIEDDEIDDDEIDDDDILDDDVVEDDDEMMNMTAAAKIYRKIASDHSKKSESLKKEGKDKEAAIETEIAQESIQLAENVESQIKSASETKKTANKEEMEKAAAIYRKIAATHKKKAAELELEGKTAEADVEDEISVEASKMAEDVESYMKKESEPEEDAEAFGGEETPEEEALEDHVAGDDNEVADDEVTEELDTSEEEVTDDLLDDDDAEITDEDKILENTAMENTITDGDADEDDMPSEEEIDAALNYSDDDDDDVIEEEVEEDIEAADEGTTKEADNKQTRKISDVSRVASVDRVEENPQSGRVNDLEDIWR